MVFEKGGRAVALFEITLIFIALVSALPVMLLILGTLDRRRIERYIESRGGKLLLIRHAWFGRHRLGTRGGLYVVHFQNHDGSEHEAIFTLECFAGVSVTEDKIVHPAEEAAGEPSPREQELQYENQRLREELERLKRGS